MIFISRKNVLQVNIMMQHNVVLARMEWKPVHIDRKYRQYTASVVVGCTQ